MPVVQTHTAVVSDRRAGGELQRPDAVVHVGLDVLVVASIIVPPPTLAYITKSAGTVTAADGT